MFRRQFLGRALALATVPVAAGGCAFINPPSVRTYPGAAAGPVPDLNQPPMLDGWRMDFSDTFGSGPLRESRWGRYGWGLQRPGNGAMGRYDIDNVYQADDTLNLRYRYDGTEWTSAGVSGAPSFTASGGRWEFRARFPRGRGLGFAFLLWPADEQWPPEVDILEGPVNGPELSAFYHYDTPGQKLEAHAPGPDRTQWHSYGVILGDRKLTYTLDGRPWAEMRDVSVTRKRMWIGFQTGAMDPNAPEAQYFEGGVPGGVPGPETPAEAVIQIDWVAHYVQA